MAQARKNFKTGKMEMLLLAKPKVDRKTGEVVNAHRCFFEIKGLLYSVDISECKKADREGLWVKITEHGKQEARKKGF